MNHKKSDTNIIELPTSVLSHISGGADKKPASSRAKPDTKPKSSSESDASFVNNPAFKIVWNWD